MTILYDLIHNFPLVSAFLAILLAQFVKVPILFFTKGVWNIRLGLSTGGMPSSHSAAVTSLSTAIAIEEGLASTAFAIAVVFSAITMFDAQGIRRHAGIHASLINRLMTAKDRVETDGYVHKTLKELLGHRPIEVLAGAVFGIVVSLLYYLIILH
jgi:acid phosphatase family membrane protein YuiD